MRSDIEIGFTHATESSSSVYNELPQALQCRSVWVSGPYSIQVRETFVVHGSGTNIFDPTKAFLRHALLGKASLCSITLGLASNDE